MNMATLCSRNSKEKTFKIIKRNSEIVITLQMSK